jgi:hypothetical protein
VQTRTFLCLTESKCVKREIKGHEELKLIMETIQTKLKKIVASLDKLIKKPAGNNAKNT